MVVLAWPCDDDVDDEAAVAFGARNIGIARWVLCRGDESGWRFLDDDDGLLPCDEDDADAVDSAGTKTGMARRVLVVRGKRGWWFLGDDDVLERILVATPVMCTTRSFPS